MRERQSFPVRFPRVRERLGIKFCYEREDFCKKLKSSAAHSQERK